MRAKSNSRKIITIGQVFIFKWRFACRRRGGCLGSLTRIKHKTSPKKSQLGHGDYFPSFFLLASYFIDKLCIGNSMTCSDVWHKYHEGYFRIVIHNFTSRVKFGLILGVRTCKLTDEVKQGAKRPLNNSQNPRTREQDKEKVSQVLTPR